LNELTKPFSGTSAMEPLLNILLCPDQPDWAFDNIANNIAATAGGDRITKLFMRDVIGSEERFFREIILKRIDVCHVFWREDLFYMLNPLTIAKAAMVLGLGYAELVKAINSCAFTTSVYDHLFSQSEELDGRRHGFSLVDGYTVSSRRLQSIYEAAPGIPPPDAVITDGVDTGLFHHAGPSGEKSPTFTIGWAGNSAWGSLSQGRDIKGYHRLFRPAMDALSRLGLPVREAVADPQVRRIPFKEMPDFFRGLDVFVCTSEMEGTPNTVLEAMACGIPVVSTDVGIVPDAFGPLQKQFVIGAHEGTEFASAIARLLADADLRQSISAGNLSRAQTWSWPLKAREWMPFWHTVLARSMDWRTANRREFLLLSQEGLAVEG